MSTQHPDNVNSPFFAEGTEIGGEDEVQEAYYAYSHLGCDEQMWDCEGKEVDNFVVKKLLTKYPSFFKEKILGDDLFLTLRVPNPTVEKAEAKILLETLESIPRSFDAARLFYHEDAPPIFEVILPMTASAKCIDRIYRYYTDFVVGKQSRRFKEGDITIGEWIGEFNPRHINVIPLFEDEVGMLAAHSMTEEYLSDKDIAVQRVFLARSDPALNYGLIGAVLLNKIALFRLHELSQKIGVEIFPIIGVGSAPFRGNLKPETVHRVISEYPSAQTFTIQSSFKYDHAPDKAQKAIRVIRESERSLPHEVDEKRCLDIFGRYSRRYQEQVQKLAPVINECARFVPERRKRKLHIGLFGYSRKMKGLSLPRAIKFAATLYSLGVPPEILGLDALTPDDISVIREAYLHFGHDLLDSLTYLNPGCGFLPDGLMKKVDALFPGFESKREHRELTIEIARSLSERRTEDISELIARAANVRNFLG